jgi:voltage-gated potassium channel
MKSIYKNLIQLISLITIFLVIGVLGFYYIENETFIDALWYATMTLTTVGYGIPDDITDEGKLFSIFLMLFGIGIVFYGLTTLSLEFINGNIFREYKQSKIEKQMNNIKNHIIICGFGRNGNQVAKKLETLNKQYVVVDKEQNLKTNDAYKNALFLLGDGVDDATLLQAGIKHAKALITALPSDADNLFIVITAKQLNPNIKIISRASNINSVNKLKIAGADNVIMPDKIGGEHMASLLVTPDLVEFIDNINIEGANQINLLEINTNNIDQNFIGKQLKYLDIRNNTGCNIIGYKNNESKYIINPEDEEIITQNSYIIVLGRPHQIQNIKKYLQL